MDRRGALRTIGGGVSLVLAGCQRYEAVAPPPSSTRTTTVRRSDRPVTITKRVEHGQTGLERVLRIEDGGRLEFDLECPDGTTETAATDLPTDDWLALRELVLESNVAEFDSRYECTGDCPRDVPPTNVTFEVDGESTDVAIGAGAELPTRLEDLLAEIESVEDRLDLPTCS